MAHVHDPAAERIKQHLDEADKALVERKLRHRLEKGPDIGLTLESIVEVRGKFAANLSYSPISTYAKWFGSPWYDSLQDLEQAVIDYLEMVQSIKGDINVNIFSTNLFDYLVAEMLGDRAVTLTVKDVYEGSVSGPRGDQQKVMITFVEKPKKFILNKTNARAIARELGPETTKWVGATITLGVDMVQVGPNSVPSIRVRSAKLDQGPATPPKGKAGAPADDLFGVK